MQMHLLSLFADSGEMPFEKKIGIIVLFGAVAIFSTVGLFASRAQLDRMAQYIGTKNHIVSRVICALGALVGWSAVALIFSTFFLHWDR